MQNKYPVTFNGQRVGEANVTQYGLYYKIYCKCKLAPKEFYRIYADAEGSTVDLGICVPDGEQFILNKLIAARKIGTAIRSFRAVCENESYVPIADTISSENMAKLEGARFVTRKGSTGLSFTNQYPVPQDNDQSQTLLHKSELI